jgi:nucleoside-diphosphate-sugar epimerase
MEVLVIRPCFVAFPEMAEFMAGKPGPEGRAEPMPYLRAYVGPEDCARGFAAAATVDYAGFEVFFLAAEDVFATEATIPRIHALYGAAIPVRDAALYERFPCASPVSHAAARARLGWMPTTRWPEEAT